MDVARARGWPAFVAEAKLAWPQLALDEATFATFVGERVVDDGGLNGAPAADLALASACCAGDKAAHGAFEKVLGGEVDAAGMTTRAPRDVVDEVKQVLRVQLLVAKDGKPPGLAGYRGKGPLRGWLRITATRELIRHKKKRAKDAPLTASLEDVLTARGATTADPMLSQLKAEYRSEFAVALRDAIASLGAEDRMLLKQSIVEGLSIDEVGAAYGVHRATAARWLARARGALVSATHAQLATRLQLPVEDIASVIRLVQSRLDASMVRYLREP